MYEAGTVMTAEEKTEAEETEFAGDSACSAGAGRRARISRQPIGSSNGYRRNVQPVLPLKGFQN